METETKVKAKAAVPRVQTPIQPLRQRNFPLSSQKKLSSIKSPQGAVRNNKKGVNSLVSRWETKSSSQENVISQSTVPSKKSFTNGRSPRAIRQ